MSNRILIFKKLQICTIEGILYNQWDGSLVDLYMVLGRQSL